MKKRLGRFEALLLSYTQLKNIRTVRMSELTNPLNITIE